VVLDGLGWCVAFQQEADGLFLSPRATRWWADCISGEICWDALAGSLRSAPAASFLVRTEALYVWRSQFEPPPASAPSRSHRIALTPRETEILDWLRQGKNGPEIAVILGCARRTVESHVARIYRKLGVKNRVQLMFQAPRTVHET